MFQISQIYIKYFKFNEIYQMYIKQISELPC